MNSLTFVLIMGAFGYILAFYFLLHRKKSPHLLSKEEMKQKIDSVNSLYKLKLLALECGMTHFEVSQPNITQYSLTIALYKRMGLY